MYFTFFFQVFDLFACLALFFFRKGLQTTQWFATTPRVVKFSDKDQTDKTCAQGQCSGL